MLQPMTMQIATIIPITPYFLDLLTRSNEKEISYGHRD
jgi:hypothetical protein